jgi:mRNA interferase RelE/StbE
MLYTVELKPSATRELKKLSRNVQARLVKKMESLASNPRPSRAKRLEGPEGFYCVRVGDYRIVYDIQDDRLVVLVIRIGHRRESYRGL